MKKAITISFTNYKGGTGKTSICINVAGALAKLGKKVLIVDFDPQTNVTLGLGIDIHTIEHTINDAILSRCGFDTEGSLKKTILQTDFEGIHLIPSDLGLSEVEFYMQNVKDKGKILDQCLEEVVHHYDFILIDTSAGSSLLMINSLMASDKLIIPVDASLYSVEAIENLKKFYKSIKKHSNHSIDEFIVVFNRYKKPNWLAKLMNQKNLTADVAEMYNEKVHFDFMIPESEEILKSQLLGMPLSHFIPETKINKVFQEIAIKLSSN